MKNVKILKATLFVAILSVVCFFGGIFLLRPNSVVNAAPIQSKQTLMLPQTEREYFSFNNLQNNAFYWDDNYAVITNNQADSTQNALWISQKPSEFIKYEGLVVKNPHQVKYYTNNRLLVLDNDNLYTVNLSNLSETATQLFYNQEPVSGRCFDVNNEYIATVSGTVIIVYQHTGLSVTNKISTLSSAKDLTPFCLDNEDNLYYIDADNSIIARSITGKSEVKIYDLEQGVNVTSIIANNNFIYFLTGENKIYQVNVTTRVKTELTSSSDFDLGNINNPTGVAFKNDNLLLTDKNGIQEFSVDEDTLNFTGYAIANGKTAYNRVGANAIDVEQYGDTVAVLDDYKLTVINTKDFDAYSPDSFINMFCGEAPDKFALGDGKVLTVKSGVVSLTKLADQTTVFNQIVDGIKDVCYQSGKYYVLTFDGVNSSVLPINENGTPLTATPYQNEEYDSICVDVLGNIVLRNDGKKYLSDLIASIFTIDGASFKVSGNTDYKETMKDDVRSFSMCFDKKEVYFISDASGFIYQTKSVINSAISALEVPEGFLVPLPTANKSDLKMYEIKDDDANLYSIKDDGTGYFEFVKFMNKENAYCVLYELNVSLDSKMLILAGVNGVILVNGVNAEEMIIDYLDSPQKVFATTSVYLYYLPLITVNGEYRLKTETDFVRIEKGSFLTLDGNSKIQFSDKEFYFASFYSNGETKSGYVPVAFTVEILSKDHVFSNFTHESVEATKLYLDKGLSIEIGNISEDQTIRLFSRGENASSVAVKINGEWVTGYIKTSAIKNTPNVAIRNILIILGVLACVCGTATFFLVRKKR